MLTLANSTKSSIALNKHSYIGHLQFNTSFLADYCNSNIVSKVLLITQLKSTNTLFSVCSYMHGQRCRYRKEKDDKELTNMTQIGLYQMAISELLSVYIQSASSAYRHI